MVVNKPTIIIYTQEADSDLLHEVCSGIEEEGLLFEVHKNPGSWMNWLMRQQKIPCLDRGSE